MDGLSRGFRSLCRLILPALIVFFSAACEPQAQKEPVATEPQPPRLVSLAPHLTELAFAAGAGQNLVGAVAYSDFPLAAKAVPRVGDAFNLDYERIAQLSPDQVLAWRGGTPATVIERLQAMGVSVLSLQTDSLQDVATALIQIAEVAGDAPGARRQAEAFLRALEDERRVVAEHARIGVFYQISLEPLYTPGGPHFISELVALCGGRNIFSDLDQAAAAVSQEAVLTREPRLIVVDRQQLEASRDYWRRFSGWQGEIAGIDADVVTRPGLRLAQGAASLCALLDRVREAT